MTMRQVCSWQHQSTSEKMMGIKDHPYGVCFHLWQIQPLGEKLPLSQLLTISCLNLTRKAQKVTAELSQN